MFWEKETKGLPNIFFNIEMCVLKLAAKDMSKIIYMCFIQVQISFWTNLPSESRIKKKLWPHFKPNFETKWERKNHPLKSVRARIRPYHWPKYLHFLGFIHRLGWILAFVACIWRPTKSKDSSIHGWSQFQLCQSNSMGTPPNQILRGWCTLIQESGN